MTMAIVLSGGGSLAAAQVGMLQALAAHGVSADLLVGTSAGALNAAYLAGRPWPDGIDELAGLWRSVRREDIFPVRPLTALRALAGHRDHLVPSGRLQRLLQSHLAYERLERAAIPVRIVATEVTTGAEVVLREGSAVDAVLASVAIPGIFPPVRIDARDLMDGSVCNNVPVSVARSTGVTDVYVLDAGYACLLAAPPTSALGMVLHALTMLLHRGTEATAAAHPIRVHIPPPLCPLAVSPADFGHTAELIERALISTDAWLQDGCPEYVYGLAHPHDQPAYRQAHAV
jgi:NTE family protein